MRKNQENNNIDSAVDKAISEMPDDFLLKDFLEAHIAEVKGMLLTEYDEVEAMEMFREEGRVEGKQEGRSEERTDIVRLIAALDKDGRINEIKRVLSDPTSIEDLYKEYGIE